LRDLEGGCRLPVAALGSVQGAVLRLLAAVAAPDASKVLRHEVSGPVHDPEALGAAVATALLQQGAATLLSQRSPQVALA
jgi:hydroxymethylbilane synthase